jgi:hypothetical protein
MKKITILFILCIFAGCTSYIHKVFVPSQVESYCKRITVSTSASTRSMKTCIQNELDAKKELSRMDIPDDVNRKCRRLSESTGGSYQVILVCVQQELSKI